ncbi:MAG: type IV pilus modification PilV family protein [bacterium]
MFQFNNSSQHAFSLLEVMLAMAIVATALVPITQNLIGTHKIEGGVQYSIDNYYLAQQLLETYCGLDFDDLTGDYNGNKEINGTVFQWTVTVSYADGDNDNNPDKDLKHISLTVGEIKLETLRFRIE